MFESAWLEHRLDKETFRKLEPQLRTDLLDAEFDLAKAKRHAVMVLLNGPDGAGKGEVLNRLYEWLDARHLDTLAYDGRTDEERLRPMEWRYWRDMPAKGEIGIVIGSWYHDLLKARATGKMDKDAFSAALHRVNEFEAMLHAEGVRFLKLFLFMDPELSWERHRRRSRKGGADQPIVEEWGGIDTRKERARIVDGALEAIRVTSTGTTAWEIVPAENPLFRDAAVGRLLLDVLRRANSEPPPAPPPHAGGKGAAKGVPSEAGGAGIPAAPREGVSQILDDLVHVPVTSGLDLSLKVDKEEYEAEMEVLQARVRRLAGSRGFDRIALVGAFEGNDAAGKGGAIRRVRACFDPRRFRVYPIAAPTQEERLYPYLWRFWRNVPRLGRAAFFDRSWYGRVLVERVEGFCRPEDWRRAYDEINDFEYTLDRRGIVVVKFWLAISPEEQMKRFKAREEVSFKRFKITEEDWRNRQKWPAYEAAVTEMVDRTSTPYAPWTLVEANDKRHARLKVVRTIADRLEAALG